MEQLCALLGVPLNHKKHQSCKQSVEYSGFLFDSFRGLMLRLDEKVALLLEHAAELSRADRLWSPRELDRVKGRFLHYSAAVRHLRIRVTELHCLMGPVPEDHLYDVPRALPDGLAALAGEMAEVIRHYGPLGAPLGPQSPRRPTRLSSPGKRGHCSAR